MARKKQIAQRKKELTAQLEDARQSISHGREHLREKFRLKKQLRKFVFKKPKTIFTGSIFAGLAATLMLRRPRKTQRPSKTAGQILLTWLLALLKPTAKAWLVTRVKKIATEQIATRTQKPTPLDTWDE